MSSCKFTGYQICTNTVTTEHLLSVKTFCLGKSLQLAPGKQCAELSDAHTEQQLGHLDSDFSTTTPQKYVGSHEDREYLLFLNPAAFKQLIFYKIIPSKAGRER